LLGTKAITRVRDTAKIRSSWLGVVPKGQRRARP